jgi:hypothetical protein
LFFTGKIARSLAALLLDLADVHDHGLALRNEVENLPVQRGKLIPEFFEIHSNQSLWFLCSIGILAQSRASFRKRRRRLQLKAMDT